MFEKLLANVRTRCNRCGNCGSKNINHLTQKFSKWVHCNDCGRSVEELD